MLYFRNDYSQGAHPRIMDALMRTNMVPALGYGEDEFCTRAADAIRARFACPGADVHFLVGGTICNLTALSAVLRPWEAVIAAETAHIAVHETGSVEATGHKVCTVTTPDGKLTPDHIRRVTAAHTDEHMVLPRLVYISNATELGTIYTKAELAALSETCRELGLLLYLDGARLGAAAAAQGSDLAPEDYARYCDAFYFGGTKGGLLFGEALVLVNDALKSCFRHAIKQRGGMLAKGRLLGVQFQAYLQDDLWLDLARHADRMARQLETALRERGYVFHADSPTNQLFVTVTNEKCAELEQNVSFEVFGRPDADHATIRFVTSWATTQADVDGLIALL